MISLEHGSRGTSVHFDAESQAQAHTTAASHGYVFDDDKVEEHGELLAAMCRHAWSEISPELDRLAATPIALHVRPSGLLSFSVLGRCSALPGLALPAALIALRSLPDRAGVVAAMEALCDSSV